MPLDTEDRRLNPAKFPALAHAQSWANRTGEPVKVWVAPPGTKHSLNDGGAVHVWFVRPANEPGPKGAEFFQKIEPDNLTAC